jgi:hypothetical protein
VQAASSVYFVPVSGSVNALKMAGVNQTVGLTMKIVFLFALIGFVKQVWTYAKRSKPQLAF